MPFLKVITDYLFIFLLMLEGNSDIIAKTPFIVGHSSLAAPNSLICFQPKS